MSTSQDQALAVAVAAMLAALAGGRVNEGRDRALATDDASLINVFVEDSQPVSDLLTGAPIDWTTQMVVQIKARRIAAASAEAEADAIYVAAYAAVCADQSIGGRVQSFVLGDVTRDRDEGAVDVHCITWRFALTHRTANNVIT